jgi:cobalt-zinc-cadmium efflux system membrane fusion protein
MSVREKDHPEKERSSGPEAAAEPDRTARAASFSRQLGLSAVIVAVLALAWLALTRPATSGPHSAAPAASSDSMTVPAAARQALQIQTSTVRAAAVEGIVEATGEVLFNADQTVKISPRLQGRIDQVLVRVGDRVAAGQTLALLDSVEAANALANARQTENKLRLAKANLDRQERLYRLGTADVTQAIANLDQAQARAQFTREVLQRTREQARIGGFTQKPLEDARQAVVGANADLAQAQADLALAQRQHDRTARLFDAGVSAKQELEAADNAVRKAQVSAQADQDKLSLAQQALEREQKAYRSNLYADQQVRSAASDYRQAQLQQEAAAKALSLARAAVRRDLLQARSDYQAAQEDAASAQKLLGLYGRPEAGGTVRITSPIAGIVVDRNVNSGQMVDQSQMTPWQMFTITNAGVVWVDADVYEKDIARIDPGQPVQVHVAALPNRRFTGTVHYVAPALDPKTHAVKVRTRIANSDGLLKDGMFVDVAIQTGRGPARTLVPLSAVQHDDQGDVVYLAEGGKFVKQRVRLGKQRGEAYEVESGLQPGEQVVTQGAIFLGGQANSD